MLRRDPRSFLEGVLEQLDLSAAAQQKLLELSVEKPGPKRVAALIAAFREEAAEALDA